jgi:hypothetical protein
LELDCPFWYEASEPVPTGVFLAVSGVHVTGSDLPAHGSSYVDLDLFPDIIIIYKNILFGIIYNSNS